MFRTKALGVCLTTALVLGAGAASAAQASGPVFYTKAAVGGTGPSVPITGTAGIAFLEGQKSKAKIECQTGTGGGEVVGPIESVKNITLFKVCEIKSLSLPCENKTAGSKEIETAHLRGELGALTATKPGVRLSPESGTYLAEFECGGGAIKVKVKGSLIGELGGASGKTVAEGKFASSGSLSFAETAGVQKYTKFMGETEGHQLENVITEGGSQHEELAGQSVKATLKSVPASDLGETL
jgi:hypothetical protein